MGSQKEISKKFKKARKETGLTQLEVAEKANVSVNYYARIERGEVSPSLETLKDIMKILKIKSLEISNP
jgi:transcriptional regulator with XRE-family HTH domain